MNNIQNPKIMSFKNIGNLGKTRNYSNYVISQYLEQHLCHKQFP